MQDQRYESNYMFPRMMLFFHANRSALLIRGLVFFLMGLLWLFYPVNGLVVLTIILGIFLLADALAALFLSFACRRFSGVVWSVLLCAAGIAMIAHPVKTDKLIMIVFGIWLFITGAGIILSARISPNRIFLLVSGIVSVLIGVVLASAPFVGLTAFSWLIALLFLISGAEMLLLVWGFRPIGTLEKKKQDGNNKS